MIEGRGLGRSVKGVRLLKVDEEHEWKVGGGGGQQKSF